MTRRVVVALFVLGTLLATAPPATALCLFKCGFVNRVPFLQAAASAPVVVYGTLIPPRKPIGLSCTNGATAKLVVGKVVRDASGTLHPNSVLYPAKQDIAEGQYLFLCDCHKGRIDPYRAIRASDAIIDYLTGGLALDRKKPSAQMLYFLNYLEHPDLEIAQNAFEEFQAVAGLQHDFRVVADSLLPAKLIRWVEDEKIPVDRRELYAVLLGHCGGEWGAVTLRRILDEACKAADPEMLEGLLIGYTLLRPENGWTFSLQIFSDPSKGFRARYAGLRAARFFREVRPSLVNQKNLLAGVALLLQQPDIADLAIEDLRRWKSWDACDGVLALSNKAEFDIPIIRRSILRYALSCPKPEAARFIQAERALDPDRLETAQELLRMEDTPAPDLLALFASGLPW